MKICCWLVSSKSVFLQERVLCFFSKVTWITTKPLDAKSCRGFARSDQLGDAKCRNAAALGRDCFGRTQYEIEEQEIQDTYLNNGENHEDNDGFDT